MPPKKKKKCRHCKGDGWFYPMTDEPCYRCVYHDFDPAKQKDCWYCKGKGYVERPESVMCCDCNGAGVVD